MRNIKCYNKNQSFFFSYKKFFKIFLKPMSFVIFPKEKIRRRKPLMQSTTLPLLHPSPPMWSMCYGVHPFHHALNFTNPLPIYLFICSSSALDF